ncbi:MAG: hypothetical protein HHJ10_01185 [Cellulomonas sp.]|uniref:hypothetical protein n=1 Tax=Cellulomonas sp. TaxID=40001 RepID=UPI00182E075A|nr:hypothetical protein [Cellulomonas sp.]NMM29683.1 hypothetical protein [Cellulomonas sp.]
MLAAIGVGVIIVIALAVGLSGRGSNASSQAGREPVVETAVRTATPHDICARQVFAIADDLYVLSDNYVKETRVNGVSDPFLQAGQQVWTMVLQDEIKVGTSQAAQNGRVYASNLCTKTLNDQIRANYPTDGTFPGHK